MFFPGFPKPWQLLQTEPWVRQHYRLRDGGTCLMLGHGESVWEDAELALENGSFDAVIASPEAAVHWPGPVLAIANHDAHADELATMAGFDRTIWCGRTAETI
jgi:hypothetical protein